MEGEGCFSAGNDADTSGRVSLSFDNTLGRDPLCDAVGKLAKRAAHAGDDVRDFTGCRLDRDYFATAVDNVGRAGVEQCPACVEYLRARSCCL